MSIFVWNLTVPVAIAFVAGALFGIVAGFLFGIFFDAQPFVYPHDPRPGEEA